jgi:predicted anti-sigma-YlaC factor YlaD
MARTTAAAMRFARATPTPDLTVRVLRNANAHHRTRDILQSPARAGLVVIAVAQLSLAVPGLLFGVDSGAPVHIAHEIGSWDVALAIGFLFVAWRPLRALGMLPFCAALVGCLGLTAVVDLFHGHAVALTEGAHLLDLLGLFLLWQLAHIGTRRTLTTL